MFKTLKVENFKVWTDTGEIKMSPITLFFGTNSSGKSSIGQLLMMLKQTVESSDRKPHSTQEVKTQQYNWAHFKTWLT